MNLTVVNTGSKGNAYILKSDTGQVLLIEVGVKFGKIKEALNFDLNCVAGCIVTHEHADHSKGMREALVFGVDVYASKGTIEAMKLKHHRLKYMEAKIMYEIGEYKVIPFNTIHDSAEPFGYLINHPECGNTMFITDSAYVPYKFPNLNNIIIEANYSLKKIQEKLYANTMLEFLHNRIVKSHMSIETCIEVLTANDLSQVCNIVLIHLSDSNSDAKAFYNIANDITGKKIHVAEKGLSIPFNVTPF